MHKSAQNQHSGIFVTGTDTGIGKTHIVLTLLNYIRSKGHTVAAMKPIAAGCTHSVDGLRNDDAVCLQAASTPIPPYHWINPYAFEPPIAPHIAAQQSGINIDFATIKSFHSKLLAHNQLVIVEGIGGWLVPLNDRETVQDLALTLALPVILVVGLRLGCLNHALLTEQAMLNSGVYVAGWIANEISPLTSNTNALIEALKKRLHSSFLSHIKYTPENYAITSNNDWIEQLLDF